VTDDRDDAEFLDGDALGEDVGDEVLPGAEGFPPERAVGVDDPSREFSDDFATRELRRDSSPEGSSEDSFVLVAPDESDGLGDTESQEVASAVDSDDSELSPEESALHIVDPDGSNR
jgi:hypothetical protein